MAGPGAGKTFCLIERIRYLIERLDIDPSRICVFTFTNKAAGEIAERLQRELGDRVERVKRGTIHSFCAELLREFGEHVDLQPGFGIADEAEQRTVLRRLRVPRNQLKRVLEAFSRYRFRGDALGHRYQKYFERYERIMAERNVADFDTLVLRTARLLRIEEVAPQIRSRWDVILVDEFQDLNLAQYAIVRRLAQDHRHIFAVGDDRQSIYSWTGADPGVFTRFQNDLHISSDRVIHIEENHRCPPIIMDAAGRLIGRNRELFADRKPQRMTRNSPFAVDTVNFADDTAETTWIIDDLRRDLAAHEGKLRSGDVGLLYRTHKIGAALESAFLDAGIACCLAHGRALTDDPVVAYALAALRVIASPGDEIQQELFYNAVLPRSLLDDSRARGEEQGRSFVHQLEHLARTLQPDDANRKKIWRGIYALRNLEALGRSHTSLGALVGDILSEKVGVYETALEKNHEELSDPRSHEEVVLLAERVLRATMDGKTAWIPRLGGAEIPGRKMVLEMGLRAVVVGGEPPSDTLRITPANLPGLGFGLGLFKTAQLIRTREFGNTFRDFTAIDIETTDKTIESAEIVELAAVRVRHGRVVGEFHSLVKPRVPIRSGARDKHKLSDADVASAPFFEEVWTRFRDFCGQDVLVAHSGFRFDFPILRRMAARLPRGSDFFTYDTLPLAHSLFKTSCSLADLAKRFGVHPGQSHRALDDCRTLARVFPALSETRIQYARKTSLVNLLDQLGIALALSDKHTLCDEARRIFDLIPPYSLGRHSDCLDYYASECAACGDADLPTVDDLIRLLGGQQLMDRLRAERSADKRYPETMGRLRRLIESCAKGDLSAQICAFLERVVLSKYDGAETERNRVNLLTLHSTKGLEFSRVYIVGVEDEELIPLPRDGVVDLLELEEARRLLYVGMTRTKDRLVMTRVKSRGEKSTGGHRFLDEMGMIPKAPLT